MTKKIRKSLLPAAVLALLLSSPAFAAGVPNSVMLGAYFNDHKEGDISLLEAEIGHTLELEYQYTNFVWGKLAFDRINQSITNGRTPLVAWEVSTGEGKCAPASDIAAGVYDTAITEQATFVRDKKVPVMLVFKPEMTNHETGVYGVLDCFYGGANWKSSNQGIINAGAKYVAAHKRIKEIFKTVGASNAQFVFAPAGRAYMTLINGKREWTYFYPGHLHTDWIGMDYFQSSPKPRRFEDDPTIQAFYKYTSGRNKPLIINQTTARANPALNPDPQTLWVTSAKEAISTKYPKIHAFLWNNNTIRNSPNNPGDTTLYLQGKGLEAFKAMAHDPVFGATDSTQFLERNEKK